MICPVKVCGWGKPPTVATRVERPSKRVPRADPFSEDQPDRTDRQQAGDDRTEQRDTAPQEQQLPVRRQSGHGDSKRGATAPAASRFTGARRRSGAGTIVMTDTRSSLDSSKAFRNEVNGKLLKPAAGSREIVLV
jgi:hypothetical protein